MENIFFISSKVYSDRSELDLSDETIRIKNFHLSRKLWWKYFFGSFWKVSIYSRLTSCKMVPVLSFTPPHEWILNFNLSQKLK